MTNRRFATYMSAATARRYVVLAAMSIAIVGCDDTVSPKVDGASSDNVESRSQLTVAFLGDTVRVSVAQKLAAQESFSVVALSKNDSSSDIAKRVFGSDVVFLVTDATQGPLPVHREHVLLLRQLGFESIGLFFANTKELSGMADAVELLELEELELREILNTYGLPGDTVPCFHDTKLPGTRPEPSLILGATATVEWLKRQKPKEEPPISKSSSKTIDFQVYLMSQLESTHSKTYSGGEDIRIFTNGQLFDAKLATDTELPIGTSSSARLHFENPVPAQPGDRIVVFHKQHVVGAGTVTHLLD